ncbi:hypothetical protein Pan241w_20800 [Gimesia alba]|uniref:Phage shock protein A n=1 Tax=Gimesia alba TaxID=2527973 RepID=A0A517RDQ4_9PLAN|nr:PspA/IM30 family protein [Gimesia alba]QDT42000.1 hypothetical protein Pan241w_20800 [Gimesia alba]
MGIFKRISDILSANLGEMLEEYENPELMLSQAISEMESSIRTAMLETAKSLASEKKLAKEMAHNENESRHWQERAAQAVASGDDELARKALSRKKEHEKLSIALHDQLKVCQDANQTLRHQLEGMKAKLAEAKRSLATLSARNKAALVRKKIYARSGEMNLDLDDTAFNKFEQMREKVEQAEAEADALAELQGIDPVCCGRDERAVCDSEIDQELEKLKQAHHSGQ